MELEREQLLATFAEEVGDLLSELEESLVALEEQPDEERLRSIFRGAHTVKGAAVALGFSGMSDVATCSRTCWSCSSSGACPRSTST